MDPRELPGVDAVLSSEASRPLLDRWPRALLAGALRREIEEARHAILAGGAPSPISCAALADRAGRRLAAELEGHPPRVVNATGTILHTNLGRAPLGARAVDALVRAASEPCALEVDLDTGERGERDRAIAERLRAITGAEDAVVVNNAAAALLLVVDTLGRRREVVVSRGEMIEIGGALRLPDVLERAGATLREVGTTNRTRVEDYAAAIGRRTGFLLRAHPSNYRVTGFVEGAPLPALAALARERAVPLVEDLGSGALVDLSTFGLPREPLPADSLRDGTDLVVFSCDKLLGGPQAGIAAGRADLVARLRRNPLRRALRVDKLVVAALAATLDAWRGARDPGAEIPALGLLLRPMSLLDSLAQEACERLRSALPAGFRLDVVESEAEIGSGAQPGARLPSRAVVVEHASLDAGRIAEIFRAARPAVLGRVARERFLLDVKAVLRADDLVPAFAGPLP
ncbi:L-seryl-tRNA(Sec) selenium transferase [bacterium]|nr:L-seryl-tRNA(Sec) selenium transferase [bacterium]